MQLVHSPISDMLVNLLLITHYKQLKLHMVKQFDKYILVKQFVKYILVKLSLIIIITHYKQL